MLTLFSWGYWGWGSTTEELIRTVDAVERARGFRPPMFYDIRVSRSVRAAGFGNNQFEKQLPKGRYRWFPRLGNIQIMSHGPGITIADPFSVRLLVEEALKYAKDNRRIIFFCACAEPRKCHRHTVARLILKEANRIHRRIQVAEWPGDAASAGKTVRVSKSVFAGVSRTLKSVPLEDDEKASRDFRCLPWGSIVDIECEGRSVPIITGPAWYRGKWFLPVCQQCAPEAKAAALAAISGKYRRQHGYEPMENSLPSTKIISKPKALTIRQPWANAIVHKRKDVENRSWRANYTGPVLIHSSMRQEKNSSDGLPVGSIIGVAELFDYVEDSTSKWAFKGDWHWLLRNARPMKPVACLGRLGLWTPSDELTRSLPKWVQALWPQAIF